MQHQQQYDQSGQAPMQPPVPDQTQQANQYAQNSSMDAMVGQPGYAQPGQVGYAQPVMTQPDGSIQMVQQPMQGQMAYQQPSMYPPQMQPNMQAPPGYQQPNTHQGIPQHPGVGGPPGAGGIQRPSQPDQIELKAKQWPDLFNGSCDKTRSFYKLQAECQFVECDRYAFSACGDQSDGQTGAGCCLDSGCRKMVCEKHIMCVDISRKKHQIIQTRCVDRACHNKYLSGRAKECRCMCSIIIATLAITFLYLAAAR